MISSNHSAVLLTLHSSIVLNTKKPSLYNKRTDWETFRELLNKSVTLQIPLKTIEEVDEAILDITEKVQQAAWAAMPHSHDIIIKEECTIIVKQKIAQKRKLRKQWMLHRTAENKRKLNKAVKELKKTTH